MVVVDTPMKEAFFITAFSGGFDRSVDANLGQRTRALERASRKGTEEQRGHTDRLDRMSKLVRPVSRVSLESVVSRDKYHTMC